MVASQRGGRVEVCGARWSAFPFEARGWGLGETAKLDLEPHCDASHGCRLSAWSEDRVEVLFAELLVSGVERPGPASPEVLVQSVTAVAAL